MKAIRARTAGFCMGVSLALRRLDKALAAWQLERGGEGRLLTLGPVIHNPKVMEEYAEKGILCIENPSQAREGDRVLIRAHGVSREVEAALAATGAVIIDATCPKVKKAQIAIATERQERGGTLLLFGEADHPEVRGLVSYADGDALIFSTEEELDSLCINPEKTYFLAAQTTQDQEAFARICARLGARLGHLLPVLSTICDATRKRQEEAIRLARTVGGMVVVGGCNSGNTRRLAEVAANQGVPVVHVEGAETLPIEVIRQWNGVGLTAGASTPAAHIDAVQNILDSL